MGLLDTMDMVGFDRIGPIYFVWFKPAGDLKQPRDLCITAEEALASVNRLGPTGEFAEP